MYGRCICVYIYMYVFINNNNNYYYNYQTHERTVETSTCMVYFFQTLSSITMEHNTRKTRREQKRKQDLCSDNNSLNSSAKVDKTKYSVWMLKTAAHK